jgi:hypothetical protein
VQRERQLIGVDLVDESAGRGQLLTRIKKRIGRITASISVSDQAIVLLHRLAKAV